MELCVYKQLLGQHHPQCFCYGRYLVDREAKDIELDLPCHRQEGADGDANDGPVTYNIDFDIFDIFDLIFDIWYVLLFKT